MTRARKDAWPEVFKEEEALARVAGDRELFAEIFSAFAEDLPLMIEELRTALSTGDLKSAQDIAHTVKGAAASISAARIMKIARLIEEAIKEGAIGSARDLAGKLAGEMELMNKVVRERGLAGPAAG